MCLKQRLTNDELSKMVDTNDEWIVQRTGIRERRIAGKARSTASWPLPRPARPSTAAGLSQADIDLIVCGTIRRRWPSPRQPASSPRRWGSGRARVRHLGRVQRVHLHPGSGVEFVKSGRYRNVLVIGAETLSRITDYTDRGSCILFGDGAGAVVLRQSPDPNRGVIYSSLHADGNGWEMLYCRPGSRHPIDAEG